MKSSLKTLIIILVVLVIGAIAYFYLSDGGFSPTFSSPLQTSTGAPVSGIASQSPTPAIDADQISQEFLSQLLGIRSIRLRDDIFSSPGFLGLQDFTLELIQPGNEGRPNPFAPFGVDFLNANDQSLVGSEGQMMPEMEPGQTGSFNPDSEVYFDFGDATTGS
jgi:hypothetical protein